MSSAKTLLGLTLATIIILTPPLIFEKYTFFLYITSNPNFFWYSGNRLWFDIVSFGVTGVISALIVGRAKKTVVLPPLIGAALFIFAVNAVPFCEIRECYVSSTDGLAPLRDFLLLASLGFITSSASMKKWAPDDKQKSLDKIFQYSTVTFLGIALSFFPIMHIFAAVSVPFPGNYLQWLLAGAPAGLACSMWLLDRGTMRGITAMLLAGLLGVIVNIALAVELPCESCSGYSISVVSILLLVASFIVPALILEARFRKQTKTSPPLRRLVRKAPVIITIVVIVISISSMWIFFLNSNYEVSVVNGFSGVTNSRFSPLEVGSSFVYSAGYLAIPRVVSHSVGVNLTFGSTSFQNFPNDFLAAGVGDQSPNCCKDGLDLAYRADAIEFSNGSEAVLARAWWACDVNMACGGYSWQQLLHIGLVDLPSGTLANWVQLEMNWTSPTLIQWFYRVSFDSNASTTRWTLYSSFVPPKIQNHYWDAGLFFVGTGNRPVQYAYFYQFGVSSAYPIADDNWQVTMHCPEIVLNNSWTCVPKAGFINGAHSFWKVIYTFGETYSGLNFSYLGNYTAEFHYTGSSPVDENPMW